MRKILFGLFGALVCCGLVWIIGASIEDHNVDEATAPFQRGELPIFVPASDIPAKMTFVPEGKFSISGLTITDQWLFNEASRKPGQIFITPEPVSQEKGAYAKLKYVFVSDRGGVIYILNSERNYPPIPHYTKREDIWFDDVKRIFVLRYATDREGQKTAQALARNGEFLQNFSPVMAVILFIIALLVKVSASEPRGFKKHQEPENT